MGQEQLAELTALAGRQAGCFSLDQSRGMGISDRRVRLLEANGLVRRVHPRTFRFASSEASPRSRAWAAQLQAGPSSVLSHEAALYLHGVGRVPFRCAVTMPPGWRHDIRGIRVHRLCDVLGEHVVDLGGLRVTTVARAVVDATSAISVRRLDDLIDRVTITEQRCTLGGIARVYRQINRRGRRRIAVLAALLDARLESGPTPRSLLEKRADELLARSGLPAPRHEMPLPGEWGGASRVDRAWPEVRLILEIDGRTWHSREQAMAKDRERDRAAGRAGWFTARVLGEEVRDHPELVVADLVELHRVRSEQLGVAARAGRTWSSGDASRPNLELW